MTIETASVDTNDNDKGSRAALARRAPALGRFLQRRGISADDLQVDARRFQRRQPATIEGNLTLLGVTKPVTLTVERFKCNPATATAKERCGGVAAGKLKRSDFGMSRAIPAIGDELVLTIAWEGNKD